MANGTVKWFSDDKGYGFITPDERGGDRFVDHTAVFANGYSSLTDRARVSTTRRPRRVLRPSTSGSSNRFRHRGFAGARLAF
jgi:CspA family cold shock protein